MKLDLEYIRRTTELKDFQISAVEASLRLKRYIISLPTGKGKTLCSLSLLSSFKKQIPQCLAVVFSTKTGLTVWEREIKKHSKFTSVEGEISSKYDISIISHSRLGEHKDKILELSKAFPVVLIIDECHYLRSQDSDLSKETRSIMNKLPYVYGLTASPLNNHIEDLFYLFESFFPGIFGMSYHRYMDTYTVRKERTIRRDGRLIKFFEVMSYKNLENLKKVIAPLFFVYQTTYDIDFDFIFLDPTEVELKRYKEASMGILDGCTDNLKDFVTRLPALQLVANSCFEDAEGAFSTKEIKLMEMVEEIIKENRSVVIFTYLRKTLFRLRDSFIGKGLDPYVITGDTPLDMRKKVSDNFGKGELVICTAAGSQSINLKAADTVIFFDLHWSVGVFVQSMGRITRQDSPHTKFNAKVLMLKGTIDEYKAEIVKANLHLINELLGGAKSFSAISVKTARSYIISLRRKLLWSK